MNEQKPEGYRYRYVMGLNPAMTVYLQPNLQPKVKTTTILQPNLAFLQPDLHTGNLRIINSRRLDWEIPSADVIYRTFVSAILRVRLCRSVQIISTKCTGLHFAFFLTHQSSGKNENVTGVTVLHFADCKIFAAGSESYDT